MISVWGGGVVVRVVVVRRVVRIFAEFEMAVCQVVNGGTDNYYRLVYVWSILA